MQTSSTNGANLNKLDEAATHAKNKSEEIALRLASLSDAALKKVEKALGSIQKQAKEYSDSAKDSAHAASDVVTNYIKEKPLQAMSFALATGILLAIFLRK